MAVVYINIPQLRAFGPLTLAASSRVELHQAASTRVEPLRAASRRMEQHRAASSNVKLCSVVSSDVKPHRAASNHVEQRRLFTYGFFPYFHTKICFSFVSICVSLIMHVLINYSYHDAIRIPQLFMNPHIQFHQSSPGVSPPTHVIFHTHFRKNLIFWIFGQL